MSRPTTRKPQARPQWLIDDAASRHPWWYPLAELLTFVALVGTILGIIAVASLR